MFDKIRFFTFHLPTMTEKMVNNAKQRGLLEEEVSIEALFEEPRDENELQLLSNDMVGQNEKFSVSGTIHTLLSYPIGAERRSVLLYLQNFSLLEVDSTYYTRRRDYPSFLMLFTYEGAGVVSYRGKRVASAAARRHFD